MTRRSDRYALAEIYTDDQGRRVHWYLPKGTKMTTTSKTPATRPSKASGTRSAPEPVGVLEIAGALGVATDTVQKWRLRFTPELADHPFPEPRWKVGGAPAWDMREVRRWCKATDRTDLLD